MRPLVQNAPPVGLCACNVVQLGVAAMAVLLNRTNASARQQAPIHALQEFAQTTPLFSVCVTPQSANPTTALPAL